jgi:threonyl-tRNA synthetase
MISIQLPDGSRREYPGPVTVAEVAQSIGSGLAKAAIAGRIGQATRPASSTRAFASTATRRCPSSRSKDPAGLEVIRHSTAHLLATR